jgi:hypothetical protein
MYVAISYCVYSGGLYGMWECIGMQCWLSVVSGELCGVYGLGYKVYVMNKVKVLQKRLVVLELLEMIKANGVLMTKDIRLVVGETVLQFGVTDGRKMIVDWYARSIRESNFLRVTRENPMLLVGHVGCPRDNGSHRFDTLESSKWK